jgi:universal stress protein E
MDNLHRAIVFFDDNSDSQNQSAVIRGIELAIKFDLELLLIAVIYDSAIEMYSRIDKRHFQTVKEQSLAKIEQTLNQVIEGIEKQGIKCQQKVYWDRHPDEIITDLINNEGGDIVIKSTRPEPLLKKMFITPVDWSLLRTCPSPVLLVKQKDWFERGAIIVAVDSTSVDPTHQELNRSLVRHAKRIAASTNRMVHVVNVYPIPILEVPVEFSAINYEELQSQSESLHKQMTAELLLDFDIPESQQHVIAGLPEEVIAEQIERLNGHLLIIGTVGRRGFSAAIIGNTAEQTIDKVGCDVLALKPGANMEFLNNKKLQSRA